MFAFIPQLLILICIVGIIIIVLRRTPEITKLPFAILASRILNESRRLGATVVQKLWHYVLDVKDLSHKITIPRLPLKSLKIFRRSNSPDLYVTEGEKALENGQYSEAEQQFIKAIKIDPHHEEAFAHLGRLYLAQNKISEAVETFKYLIKHHPENPSYYSSLGQAHHNKKQFDNAIEAFEKAVELSPDHAKLYMNLGFSLEAKKHLEEAILNYRRAMELEKDNAHYVMILSEALTKKGDKEEAEALLEKVLIMEPTNQEAREKLMQLKY